MHNDITFTVCNEVRAVGTGKVTYQILWHA